jgi:recombination protein RecT
MAQSASTEVAARTQANEIVEWMRSDERRNQIGMALPETVSLDRFERLTATALLANPEILKAERASLYLAILKAAQAGLVPDGKQGAIVVFGNKASFMPMIGGVRDTLAEYGWTLATSVIYAADEFAIDVAEGRVTHRQPRPGVDRGAAEGAYAQAVHRDGRRMAEMMTVAEINYVRDKSARSKNVWNDWWTRMAEKTVGHRLAKKLPLAEAERDRIARIVNEDFEPGAGAAVLYGQPRPELQPASTPTPQAASEDVADAHVQGADGSDATSQGAEEDVTPSSSSDEPGPDLPQADPGPAVPAELQAAADAGAAFNPQSKNWRAEDGEYMTVGEIFEAGGEKGREWIVWCLEKARGEKLKAVTDFAAVYFKEALS